jgi:hypothetical protein
MQIELEITKLEHNLTLSFAKHWIFTSISEMTTLLVPLTIAELLSEYIPGQKPSRCI